MQKKIVLIAGYTLHSYLEIIKKYFAEEDVLFAVAYTRQPITPTKQEYLNTFDRTFDLTTAAGIEALRSERDNILLVTNTQERDVETYIDVLALCGKITQEEAALYRKLVNKESFKGEMVCAGHDIVPSYHVLTDDTVEEIASSVTYPQVIKPTGLAGSAFVKLVHDKDAFVDFYRTHKAEILRYGSEYYQKEIKIIAETFLVGPQYSVNAYIDAQGVITLCPIIRVIPATEIGINDTYSVYQYTHEELDAEAVASLRKALETVVAHFRIRNTSAHFDTVLTRDGWKLFEVGLRIGGNRQHFFTRSHGMNHLHNDLANRLGRTVSIPSQIRNVCIVQKGTEKRGVLKKITYHRAIAEEKPALIEEDKIKKIGEAVGPVSEGSATLIRFFVTHKEYQKVLDASIMLFNDVEFVIE